MIKYYCNSCGAELTGETICKVCISSAGAFALTSRTIHMCSECLKNTLGYAETQKIQEENIMREKRIAERKARNKASNKAIGEDVEG